MTSHQATGLSLAYGSTYYASIRAVDASGRTSASDSGDGWMVQWTQQGKIEASDKQADDLFGEAVAINGGYAVVGAAWEDTEGSNAGAAYIFKRDGTSWSQQAIIYSTDLEAGDKFGFHSSSISFCTGIVFLFAFARSRSIFFFTSVILQRYVFLLKRRIPVQSIRLLFALSSVS